ncbi:MAG: hypothetical protein KF775_08220 [Cyclobacteriaceae bacterium]|nr:hypothetical protein [Cyclobacteriaceae bacterium]
MKASAAYTFKNSANEKPCTVLLSDYNLMIQTNEAERSIPYANVTSVRLSRTRNKFLITIQPDGQLPVTVSNQYYLSGRTYEDRSRQYTTFVRILHYHLKEKSTAEYECGSKLNALVTWGCVLVLLSFGVALVLEYLRLSPLNFIGLAILVSMGALGLLVLFNWGRFPNIYKPDQIPLQFLPD